MKKALLVLVCISVIAIAPGCGGNKKEPVNGMPKNGYIQEGPGTAARKRSKKMYTQRKIRPMNGQNINGNGIGMNRTGVRTNGRYRSGY